MLIEEQTRFLDEVAEILIRDADTNHRNALAEARHELNMWRRNKRASIMRVELDQARQRIADLETSAADDRLAIDGLRVLLRHSQDRAEQLVTERDRLRERVAELEKRLQIHAARELDQFAIGADGVVLGAEPETYHYWVVYVYRELQGGTWVQSTDSLGMPRSTPILTRDDMYRLGEQVQREFRSSSPVTTVNVISATLLKG
jgi:hypothetical protein